MATQFYCSPFLLSKFRNIYPNLFSLIPAAYMLKLVMNSEPLATGNTEKPQIATPEPEYPSGGLAIYEFLYPNGQPNMLVTTSGWKPLTNEQLQSKSPNGFTLRPITDMYPQQEGQFTLKQRCAFSAYIRMNEGTAESKPTAMDLRLIISDAFKTTTQREKIDVSQSKLYVQISGGQYLAIPWEVLKDRYYGQYKGTSFNKIPIIDPASSQNKDITLLKDTEGNPFFTPNELAHIQSGVNPRIIRTERHTPEEEALFQQQANEFYEKKRLTEEKRPSPSEVFQKKLSPLEADYPELKGTFVFSGNIAAGANARNFFMTAGSEGTQYNLRTYEGSSIEMVNKNREEHRLLEHLGRLEGNSFDFTNDPQTILGQVQRSTYNNVFLATLWSTNEGATYVQEYAPPSLIKQWESNSSSYTAETSTYIINRLFKSFTLLYNSGRYFDEVHDVILLPPEDVAGYRGVQNGKSVLAVEHAEWHNTNKSRDLLAKFLDTNCRYEEISDPTTGETKRNFKFMDLNVVGTIDTNEVDDSNVIGFHESIYTFVKAAEIIMYSPSIQNPFSDLISKFTKSSADIKSNNDIDYCRQVNEEILTELQRMGLFYKTPTPLPALTAEQQMLYQNLQVTDAIRNQTRLELNYSNNDN